MQHHHFARDVTESSSSVNDTLVSLPPPKGIISLQAFKRGTVSCHSADCHCWENDNLKQEEDVSHVPDLPARRHGRENTHCSRSRGNCISCSSTSKGDDRDLTDCTTGAWCEDFPPFPTPFSVCQAHMQNESLGKGEECHPGAIASITRISGVRL